LRGKETKEEGKEEKEINFRADTAKKVVSARILSRLADECSINAITIKEVS
jgi:hypothetical protein